MTEDMLIYDTSNLQEVLFDDIRDLSIHNGIFRCTLYAYRVVPPPHVYVAADERFLRRHVLKVATG